MRNNNHALYKMIEQDGIKGTISALALVLHRYADDMSDFGMKLRAMEAAKVAEMLNEMEPHIDPEA